MLTTGDQRLARFQLLAEVTAVTFERSDDPDSLLKPEHPTARPDYDHIAWYLAEHVPRE